MSRGQTNAARVLEKPLAEVPILIGDGCEVFEGWGSLTPEQVAECEQADADLRSGRVTGATRDDVQRVITSQACRRMSLSVVWTPQALAALYRVHWLTATAIDAAVIKFAGFVAAPTAPRLVRCRIRVAGHDAALVVDREAGVLRVLGLTPLPRHNPALPRPSPSAYRRPQGRRGLRRSAPDQNPASPVYGGQRDIPAFLPASANVKIGGHKEGTGTHGGR